MSGAGVIRTNTRLVAKEFVIQGSGRLLQSDGGGDHPESFRPLVKLLTRGARVYF